VGREEEMIDTILVTGSEGFIGTSLVRVLGREYRVRGFDVRARARAERGSILDCDELREAMKGCAGVVHLAAVSRVAWGEQDPDGCWRTNVDGTRNVLDVATTADGRPWVLLASSREVYGQPLDLPVTEDAPLRPFNVYGRSKAKAERLLAEATSAGHSTAVVRLTNVYGGVHDHPDRVIPAFCRAVLSNEPLRVDGPDREFDFTHVDDVTRGIRTAIEMLESGTERIPPIHLTTGRPTSLVHLAHLVRDAAGSASAVRRNGVRPFDVDRFYGDPTRAREALGWKPRVSLDRGVSSLVGAYRAHGARKEVAS